MPVVYKLDQDKKRGRPVGSKNKIVENTEDTPVKLYTWICKCGKKQVVGIRCYSVKCGCNKMMACQDEKGVLK